VRRSRTSAILLEENRCKMQRGKTLQPNSLMGCALLVLSMNELTAYLQQNIQLKTGSVVAENWYKLAA
jgi:hypothetical protein